PEAAEALVVDRHPPQQEVAPIRFAGIARTLLDEQDVRHLELCYPSLAVLPPGVQDEAVVCFLGPDFGTADEPAILRVSVHERDVHGVDAVLKPIAVVER